MSTNNDMVFGRRPVIEAIKAGKSLDKIFVQRNLEGELADELFSLVKENKLVFTKVPIEKLNRLTRKNHQGIVAFISPIDFSNIDHIIDQCYAEGRNPLVLVLDRITDVRNFGAIVRTAECSGVDAILIPARGAAQISGDAMKTSAGALNLVPICRTQNLIAQLKLIQQSGISLVACTEKATETLYNTPFTQPSAIIMGAEDTGISPDILDICEYKAQIPMVGKIESLNVSTSTGIILYEAIRQRNYTANN
ncbi:MAG: 23S rRNA (guanosine(2251)-2'-O)-methyltransferase RlmB [Bacteroidota bacterium]